MRFQLLRQGKVSVAIASSRSRLGKLPRRANRAATVRERIFNEVIFSPIFSAKVTRMGSKS